MQNWILWSLVIGFLIVLWVGVIGIIYRRQIKKFFLMKFMRKDMILAYFFNANNQIDIYPTRIIDKAVIYNGKRYIVKPENLRYIKSVPVGLFIEGFIFPIDFSLNKEAKEISIKADAKSFNDIMENKIIKDLVNEGKQMKLIMIIVIATLIMTFLVVAHQYGLIDVVLTQAPAGAS